MQHQPAAQAQHQPQTRFHAPHSRQRNHKKIVRPGRKAQDKGNAEKLDDLQERHVLTNKNANNIAIKTATTNTASNYNPSAQAPNKLLHISTTQPNQRPPPLSHPKDISAATNQPTTTRPHAPSQPFMPCKPHKHWFKEFSNNFGIYFCDFCVTFATSAFAPVFPLHPLRSRPRIPAFPQRAAPCMLALICFCAAPFCPPFLCFS